MIVTVTSTTQFPSVPGRMLNGKTAEVQPQVDRLAAEGARVYVYQQGADCLLAFYVRDVPQGEQQ